MIFTCQIKYHEVSKVNALLTFKIRAPTFKLSFAASAKFEWYTYDATSFFAVIAYFPDSVASVKSSRHRGVPTFRSHSLKRGLTFETLQYLKCNILTLLA